MLGVEVNENVAVDDAVCLAVGVSFTAGVAVTNCADSVVGIGAHPTNKMNEINKDIKSFIASSR
jgi:hypothetical protein